MSWERLLVGLAICLSLFTVGCGGSSTASPGAILGQFQKDNSAAVKKYQGQTLRLTVDKVTTAGKSGKAMEYVTVQGQVGDGKIMIDATFADPAEQPQALALKIGEPATFEGEVVGGMGEKPGFGVVFMKATKVVPR